MKSLRVLLFFGFFFASFAEAADPYDPPQFMPEGPFKGDQLDTSEKRAAVWLGDNQFANFYHHGRFWKARYDSGSVQEVIFQIEHWRNAGPAAHIQLRFQMKPEHPLRITPQDGRPARPTRLRDVILSGEATHAVGRPHVYNAWDGINQHYGFTGRVVSLDTKVKQLRREPAFRVEQLRLNLPDEVKTQLLSGGVQMSSQMGHAEMYNTLTNSCTTFAWDILDDVLKYKGWRRLATHLDQIPILARFYLFARNLIEVNGANRLPDLQEEIWGPYREPATCQGAPETLSALGSIDPDRQ